MARIAGHSLQPVPSNSIHTFLSLAKSSIKAGRRLAQLSHEFTRTNVSVLVLVLWLMLPWWWCQEKDDRRIGAEVLANDQATLTDAVAHTPSQV